MSAQPAMGAATSAALDEEFDDHSLITVTPLHPLNAAGVFTGPDYRILDFNEIRSAQRELEIAPRVRDSWFQEAGLESGLEQMDQLSRDLLIEWAGWASGRKLHKRFPQFTPKSLDRLRAVVLRERRVAAPR